jgi:hypothetical protein
MTQAFRFMQRVLFVVSFCFSRVLALFSSQKHLYTDRFATKAELQTHAHETSFGLEAIRKHGIGKIVDLLDS